MHSSPTAMLDPTRVDITTYRLDFSFAAHAFLKKMGVAEQIDTLVAKHREPEGVEPQAKATGQFLRTGPSEGQCVEAMVLNVLEGRVALYNMASWLQTYPVEEMWGPSVTSTKFEDMRLARALDSLWEVGWTKCSRP